MGSTGEIRDLIQAAAEGAREGLVALRAAGIPAALGAFSVEIDYERGASDTPAIGAAVRLSIVTEQGGSSAGTVAGP